MRKKLLQCKVVLVSDTIIAIHFIFTGTYDKFREKHYIGHSLGTKLL